MERLFIYVFIGLVLLSGVIFYGIRHIFLESEDQELNFTDQESGIFGDDSISPAPREHVSYQDVQISILVSAIKRAPRVIMTTVFIQLFLMLFTGYLSLQNIERLAMAGSALSQGDYGMVASALYPIGKEAVVEQSRIARGNHPYLDEKGLHNFSYIGQFDEANIAIMDHLYSTQDHDLTLEKGHESYGIVLTGLSVGKIKDICEDKYNGKLISKYEWDLSRGHFLAARNVKEFPKIPEWTRDFSEEDSDDFYVIEKDSGVYAFAEKENIDREEGGYIDGDDLSTAGFRCSVTW